VNKFYWILALALTPYLYAEEKTPEKPAVESKESKPKVLYVASKIRQPFHDPSCEWAKKISEDNKLEFTSWADAMKEHRPCKVCNPKPPALEK
jgi:methylphosphotriester-DNA--protein-cysteine methyltransferase